MIWIYGHHQVPFSIFGHYLEIPLPYSKLLLTILKMVKCNHFFCETKVKPLTPFYKLLPNENT